MRSTEKILLEFDPRSSGLLPALKKISASFGYVSKKDAKKLADYFSVSLSKVFETASFYDLIKVRRPAKLTIQVCSSANCVVNNSLTVIKEIENFFHITAGNKNNPKICLEEISCLGKCEEGPVMVVNGDVYTQVAKSLVYGILEKYL